MQTCSICHAEKEETEFGTYLYKGQAKRKAHCKQCYRQIRHQSWLNHRRKHLDKAKVYRQKHKEEFRLRQQKWYAKNRTNEIQRLKSYRSTWEGKIHQWKQGAKRRKIDWQLTNTFIRNLPMFCHYTGETLTLEVGLPNTVSIDRLDSNKPYEKTNVVLCTTIVNSMKMDLPKNVFVETCRKITSHTSQLSGS